MAKKHAKNKKHDSKKKTADEFPDIPDEAKKKLEKIKDKLEKFKDKLIERFEENVIGVALLPPSKDDDKKDKINVLVLIDDTDSKKMSKDELREKITGMVEDMAKKVEASFNPEVLLLSDLWQNCYDAKYELLQVIAQAAPIYDKGMLAAVKLSEIHKTMVLKKFEKYIVSYVLVGSLVQGKATPESDIDVFIVIDDTDVKKMTRAELKDKLRAIIIGMGVEAGRMTGIENKINIQVYILTDFWENIKEANPVIFTFLRDGIPFYDRGIFMPWKQLLQMGRVKPSPEAIDMFKNSGDQMLDRVKLKLKEIGMEDFFWAALTTSQAAIMLYGLPPPTPKECPELMRHLFVKKEKLLEDKYVKTLEKVVQTRKELEHGTIKNISGKEIDELFKDTEEFLERFKKLFEDIDNLKEKEALLRVYEDVILAVREALRTERVIEVHERELFDHFKLKLINSGKLPANMHKDLMDLAKLKKEFEQGKLTRAEANKAVSNARALIRALIEYVQRSRAREIEQLKIRVKYGKKLGEVIILDDFAFIVLDIEKPEAGFKRAKIRESGLLTDVDDSSPEEFEKKLSQLKNPRKVFISGELFDSLRRIFGKEMEILLD